MSIAIGQAVPQALLQHKTTLQQPLPQPGSHERMIVRTPVWVMFSPPCAGVQVHAPQRHLREAFQGHEVLLGLQPRVGQAPDKAEGLWPMQPGKEGVDSPV